MSETNLMEPTLLSAVRHNWRAGLAAAVAAGALALLLLVSVAGGNHVAQASILLEDPREGVLFQSTTNTNTNYVADQIDILQSPELARLSAQAAQAEDPAFPYDTLDYLDRTSISAGDDRALVTISFNAENPEWAVLGANSVITAYEDFLEVETTDAYAASITALDEEVTALENEIAAIQTEIDSVVQEETPGLEALRTQVRELIPILTRAARDLPTAGEGRLEAIDGELERVSEILAATERVDALGSTSQLAVLEQRLSGLVDRAASMAERRDNLRVDSSLLGAGIRLATPAVVSEESSVLGLRNLLAIAFIAGLAGVGTAYLLSLRRRAFRSPTESAVVLEAPVVGVLPASIVTDGHARPQAYGSTARAIGEWRGTSDDETLIVGLSAARRRAGVTTTVAQVGRMLAEQGHKTLVVDGDFESKELTRTLAPQAIDGDGLVQLTMGSATPRQILVDLEADTNGLSLLPAGNGELAADDARALTATIERAATGFDVVLIDLPGDLSDPRTAVLARGCGKLLTLVGHGDRMFEVERLREDLGLLGVACDGVVFTEARSSAVGSAV